MRYDAAPRMQRRCSPRQALRPSYGARRRPRPSRRSPSGLARGLGVLLVILAACGEEARPSLRSEDPLARRAAARALARNPAEAVESLDDLLAALEPPGARNEVSAALAAAGPDAVGALVERLSSRDGGLRLAALAALHRIGSPRSRAAILPLTRDRFPVVRHEAVAALERLRALAAREQRAVAQAQEARDPSPATLRLDLLPQGVAPPAAVRFEGVALEEEIRPAVEASPGHPLETPPFEATPGSALAFAFGRLAPAAAGEFPEARFEVEVREDPGGETLAAFSRRLGTGEEDLGWKTARLDLSRFAGRRVRARFEVDLTGDPAGASPSPLAGAAPRVPRWLWARPRLQRPCAAGPPSILLVSIDTLRADHLGCYGYPRPTSPTIDALAREGVRFDPAISQAPWTTPSHMSLFTSLVPSTHKVNQDWARFQSFQKGRGGYRPLADGVPTLATWLQSAGYRTLAITGGGTVAGALGFARGFDVYREDASQLHPGIVSRLGTWLDDVSGAPFFLFLHTFEVHSPYSRGAFLSDVLPPPERDRLQRFLDDHRRPTGLVRKLIGELKAMDRFQPDVCRALYDGGIRFTDDFLGWLLDDLRARGLLDRMILVVLSDHGEEFADHSPTGFYGSHGWSLFDELIRVPLIVRLPGGTGGGRVVTTPVQLLDVAPTLLDLAGIEVPASLQGRSLAGALAGVSDPPTPWTWSEATDTGLEWKAMRSATMKYILAVTPEGGERTGIPGEPRGEKLFDLQADPGEETNLHEAKPELVQQLRRELLQRFRSWGREGVAARRSIELTEEQKKRLRALGYIR